MQLALDFVHQPIISERAVSISPLLEHALHDEKHWVKFVQTFYFSHLEGDADRMTKTILERLPHEKGVRSTR